MDQAVKDPDMTKKRHSHVMTVTSRSGAYVEPVPTELNRNGAPDLAGCTPIECALQTVQWFNDTRNPQEDERKVLKVEEVTYQTIFEATA
jgi:hypothetical protein